MGCPDFSVSSTCFPLKGSALEATRRGFQNGKTQYSEPIRSNQWFSPPQNSFLSGKDGGRPEAFVSTTSRAAGTRPQPHACSLRACRFWHSGGLHPGNEGALT